MLNALHDGKRFLMLLVGLGRSHQEETNLQRMIDERMEYTILTHWGCGVCELVSTVQFILTARPLFYNFFLFVFV